LNSIISIVNIADAAISALARQFTCTQELATSMKSLAAKALCLPRDSDQMLFTSPTKNMKLQHMFGELVGECNFSSGAIAASSVSPFLRPEINVRQTVAFLWGSWKGNGAVEHDIEDCKFSEIFGIVCF
jgi:hypothetical protein